MARKRKTLSSAVSIFKSFKTEIFYFGSAELGEEIV